MNATLATLVLIAVWLGLGVVTGVALHRRGHPPATSVTAVLAWPVLVPLLGGVPSGGPFAERIAGAFTALRAALADPAAAGVVQVDELVALESAQIGRAHV